MPDDALGDDLVIDEAFVDKVKKRDGRWLNFDDLSDDETEKLRDEHVITFIENHCKADEVKIIYLNGCVGITDATLAHIAIKCTQLETLYVPGCDQITNDGIQAIVEKIGNNLRQLSYDNCNRCSNAALQAIVQHCCNLEELYASNTGIAQMPDSIGQKLPKLYVLDLQDNNIKRLPPSITLLRNDTLEEFRISGNPLEDTPADIAEKGIDAICEHLKRADLIRNQGFAHKHRTGGLNDAPAQGPDRLGYRKYGKAISGVARQAEQPNKSVCGAYFGGWGTGKSTLEELRREEQRAWTKQRLAEILQELKDKRKKKEERGLKEWQQWWRMRKLRNWISELFSKSVQFLCDIVGRFLCNCCDPSLKTECVAAFIAFPLFWPISICLLTIGGFWCIKKEGQDIFEDLANENTPLVENKQTRKDKKSPQWEEVLTILLGSASSLHSQKSFYERTFVEKLQFLLLSCALQPLMKIILLPFRWFGKILHFLAHLWKKEDFEYHEDLPEYIYVDFNAWVYQGTDLLWASLLETMWEKIEAKHGKYSVRLHRASIELSGELDDDDLKTRQGKREAAIFFLKLKAFLFLSLALFATIYLWVVGIPFNFWGLDDIYNKIILQVTATSPLMATLYTFVSKVLPELRNSRGAQIMREVQSFEKYSRADFTKNTGFMGRVKKEMGYMFDYLKTQRIRDEKHQILRGVRLVIFVDDLDRCQAKTIMAVLEAVVLLLVDAPVTIFIAIESRVVVASIEEHMGPKFKDEGLDGYKFLEKIVNIPFCIPDLNRQCKDNYLTKIFVSDELKPKKVWELLHFLLNEASMPAIRELVKKNGIQLFEKDKMVESLLNVMENMMLEGIIVHDEKTGSMIRGPAEVRKEVRMKLAAEEALGDQLEEEFVAFISSGIQEVLKEHDMEKKTVQSPRNPSPANESQSNVEDPLDDANSNASDSPASRKSNVDPLHDANFNISGSSASKQKQGTPQDVPPRSSTAETGSISDAVEKRIDDLSSSGAVPTKFSQMHQPLMDALETSWFNKYSDHLIGQPRKIKRIINSYMISRSVIEDLKPQTDNSNVFQEKLLKLIILLEQWPYRMAWMLIIVENLQKENRIIQNHKNNKRRQDYLKSQSLMKILHEVDSNRENNGTSLHILDCLDYPLLEVYHLLVQGLMHSPNDAHIQLQRDADPQLFEMLLSEPSESEPSESEPSAILTMKDLRLEGEEGTPPGDTSLRPFAFNIQRHMTEKVQNYYDSCKVHVHRGSGGNGTTFGAFEKKSNYFYREHDAAPGSAQAQTQDQTLYSLFHQSLQSSAKDEDKELSEAIKNGRIPTDK
jgi:Leucine-rich repeat (LRR) protein